MTTLKQFRTHLADIDRLAGTSDVKMWECDPRRVRGEMFAYDFDGYLTCVVRFERNGKVTEWQDCSPEEAMKSRPARKPRRYKSPEAWKQALVRDSLNV